MDWQKFVTNCQNTLEANKRLGGDSRPLIVEEPATEEEIIQVEKALETKIPESLRKVLISYSKHLYFSWFLPQDKELPVPFRGIFCGDCNWSLDLLIQHNLEKDKWVAKVFPNPKDDYDVIWHNKFAFQEVRNGDYLAIDLGIANREPVVYLSHDDGQGHGYELGEDFQDFLDRWGALGCPGAEDWQWLPFTRSSKSFIEPQCPNAIAWKKLFGLI